MGEFGDIEKKGVTGEDASAVPEGASSPQTCACESDEVGSCEDDAVLRAEQEHLSETYATLDALARSTYEELLRIDAEAAADKIALSEELSVNLETYADAMETYADFAAMNRVIDGHNTARASRAARLSDLRLLLKQPYFAKIALQYKPGQEPKEFYLGAAGVSDDDYRRIVVDWRSPIAEVYYNQANGPTSYEANGRTINVDLKLRRQFDIEGPVLNAYFDTTVAIQDALLLASLSKQRSARMQAITATIQKEQNAVVRHEDVPALLVNGIAGSGKTSVLLQRIAYLFYRRRDDLDPSEVVLVTPNPVFRAYIADVLPDMGESNPQTITWDEFAREHLSANHGGGSLDVPLETLWRIDEALEGFEFTDGDFRDVTCAGVRIVGAGQIHRLSEKHRRAAAGPHRVTLMREDLLKRVESRIAQMAGGEDVQDEMASLSVDEQLRLFGEIVDPQDEREARALAMTYLKLKFADAYAAVEHDDWLRIDRIGMRLLGAKSLAPVTWLYLRMALTGAGDASVKYVMIDEVQDYTAAQIAVLGRYYKRAHFMLLGDKNQAIDEGGATFEEIDEVMERLHGRVSRCHLMTSYRSSPEITELFASLLPADERMRISSVQREQVPTRVLAYDDEGEYARDLRAEVADARAQVDERGGTCAVIVPWKSEAKRIAALLGESAPELVGDASALPDAGVVMIPLKLAKGLEFDRVIIPDASARLFPENELSRNRLYTTISRATRQVTVMSRGPMSGLLA